MPDGMNIPRLLALDNHQYAEIVKGRLRIDTAWVDLCDPILAGRTRQALQNMIASIDRQIERIGESDPAWLRGATTLKRYAKERLDRMPIQAEVVPGSKEARAWKAFSASLARALAEGDLAALDRIQTPYGGLTARAWLSEREAKR